MSVKRFNNLKRVVLDNGLDILDAGTDGTRWYVVAQAKNGETSRFTFSKKEGDLRGDLNESARIKRFATGNGPQPDLPEIQQPTEKDVNVTVKRKMRLVSQETPPEPVVAAPAPTPSPEPEKPASEAASRQRNQRLDRQQFYKLTKLVEPMDTLQFATLDALAKHASEQLGFVVNKSSAADVLEALGKMTAAQHTLHHPKGRAKAKPEGGAIMVLAKSLCTLFEHLGEPVPEELRGLLK